MRKIDVTYHYVIAGSTYEDCVTLSVSDEKAKELTDPSVFDQTSTNRTRLEELIARLVVLQDGNLSNIVDIRESEDQGRVFKERF